MSRDTTVLIWLGNCLLAAWNLGRVLPWWWDRYVPVDRGLRIVTALLVAWNVATIAMLVWVVRHA